MIHRASLLDNPVLGTLLLLAAAAAALYLLRLTLWIAGLAAFAYRSSRATKILGTLAPKLVAALERDRKSVEPEILGRTDALLRVGFVLGALALLATGAVSALIVLLTS